LVDANLPPLLADTIRPLAEAHGVPVDWIPALYGDGIKDEEWIARASAEGGALFLTLDKHIRTRPLEIQALIASRCVGVILASQWQQDEDYDLAARILRRWPHILECMRANPPALFEFTWSWEARPPRPWRGLGKINSLIG
jgi:hypothetical protein